MKNPRSKKNWKIWRIGAMAAALMLSLAVAVPVLAGYLGPDRTRTVAEIVRTGTIEGQTCAFAGGQWRYIVTSVFDCSDPSRPWLVEYPDLFASCDPSANGTRVWHDLCIETVTTRIVNYPPAEVSGSVQCAAYGSGGWCILGAGLSLAAHEPLAGYNILALEGTRNGIPFACASTACSLPLLEGQNDFTFWALSSWGDSSLMGTAGGKVDTRAPVIGGSVTGTTGDNGWFISEVTLAASAADLLPGSGLDAFDASLDGGAWAAFPGSLLLSDGEHTLHLRSADAAGNISTLSQPVNVDTSLPVLSVDVPAPDGTNGWYTHPPTFSAAASDMPSGLAGIVYQVDGGSVTSGNRVTLNGEGGHSITFQAADRAGNVSTVVQTANVDSLPPVVSVSAPPVPASGWYTSPLNVSAVAADATSGVASAEVSADHGATWSGSILLADGVHMLQLRAADQAGNPVSASAVLRVDTLPPTVQINISGRLGQNNWYTSPVTLEIVAGDATSGVALAEYRVDGGAWQSGVRVNLAVNGVHTVEVRVADRAGNTAEQAGTVKLETALPQVSLHAPAAFCPACGGIHIDYSVAGNTSGIAAWELAVDGMSLASGNSPASGTYIWNGTTLNLGPHTLTLTARDLAGNIVSISQNITLVAPTPTSVPPEDVTQIPSTEPHIVTSPTPTQTVSPTVSPMPLPSPTRTPSTFTFGGATPTQTGNVALSSPPDSQNPEDTDSSSQTGILWGAAATAVIGTATAYALDQRRKRKEEDARQQAEVMEDVAQRNAEIEAAKVRNWLSAEADRAEKSQKAYQEWLRTGENSPHGLEDVTEAERLAEYKSTPEYQAYQTSLAEWQELQNRIRNIELSEMTEAEKLEELKKSPRYQAFQASLAYIPEEQIPICQIAQESQPPKKSWWEKTIDFLDQHQVVASIVIGIGVGIAAIAIIATGGMAVPLVVAGAAAVAAALTAGGTMALNAYYDRPLGENIQRNTLTAAFSAVLTSTLLYWIVSGGLQGAIYSAGNGIAAYCLANPTTCARAEFLLNAFDTIEQFGLTAQMAVQLYSGDTAGAMDTYLELQAEQMDGGMPGNTVANEAAEQLAKLGNNVFDLVDKYGDDVVPFLVKYGDDAADVISKYGDDAIDIIEKYGDDGFQLLVKYGDNFLDSLDGKVVNVGAGNADDFARNVAMLTGTRAWSSSSTGLVYVSRSTGDSVDAVEHLIKLDPESSEAKEFIDIIVRESTRGDNARLVLGRFGANGEYLQNAIDNGGSFLDVGPDVNQILIDNKINFWVINEKFLQSRLEAGVERVDFVSGDIWKILDDAPDSFAANEIRWMQENAGKYGYELCGNGWIKIIP